MAVVMTSVVARIPIIAAMITIESVIPVTAIVRRVYVAIPVVVHEIDGLAAGVVTITVPVPVLIVPRWNAKVDWTRHHGHRGLVDDDRMRMDDLWLGNLTDIDAAIESRLANTDRNADVSR